MNSHGEPIGRGRRLATVSPVFIMAFAQRPLKLNTSTGVPRLPASGRLSMEGEGGARYLRQALACRR
jgi:hypothetical protein